MSQCHQQLQKEAKNTCIITIGSFHNFKRDVLWNLEYVLQLQEADQSMFTDVDSITRIDKLQNIILQMLNSGSEHQ